MSSRLMLTLATILTFVWLAAHAAFRWFVDWPHAGEAQLWTAIAWGLCVFAYVVLRLDEIDQRITSTRRYMFSRLNSYPLGDRVMSTEDLRELCRDLKDVPIDPEVAAKVRDRTVGPADPTPAPPPKPGVPYRPGPRQCHPLHNPHAPAGDPPDRRQ